MLLKLSEHSLGLLLLRSRANEHSIGYAVQKRHVHILSCKDRSHNQFSASRATPLRTT